MIYTVKKEAQERIHDKLADILTTSKSDKYLKIPDPEHLREWLSEGECDIAVANTYYIGG